MNFTFSIPRITVQLLQLTPTNAHIVLGLQKYYNKQELLHVSGLIGPSLLSTMNCTKWLLNTLGVLHVDKLLDILWYRIYIGQHCAQQDQTAPTYYAQFCPLYILY